MSMGRFNNIHVYFHDKETEKLIIETNKRLDIMAKSMTEHTQELIALKNQNDKAHQEHLAKLAELEAALLAAGNTTPEVDAAFADLKASIQRDDDLVPDAPVG